jgi:arylsulfatase A-like enzyme
MRPSTRFGFRRAVRSITILLVALSLLAVGDADLFAAKDSGQAPPSSSAVGTEYVILFVLEGVGQASLKGGTMPVLSKLVGDGSVTWTATSLRPALRLPLMASLITGVSADRHGITWNTFEFSRGYPREPTVFDYLDLSGGRDSAIFFMDESLYQLAKPEPYTDYQMCGPLRPECNTARVISYVRDYFKKATSGHGHGHAILALPHFLVIHLPAAGRAGETQGWQSADYRESLKAVDKAMGSVLDLYKELGLLKRTTVFVTSLSSVGEPSISAGEGQSDQSGEVPKIPWIASGVGIKKGHAISQPVSLIDTGATVMRALGLETHTEWDSHAIEEIFKTASSSHASDKHQ